MKRGRWWLVLTLALVSLRLVLGRTGLFDARAAAIVLAGLEVLVLAVAGRQILLAIRRYRRDRTAGLDVWAALEEGLAVLLPRPLARLAALEPRLWYCLGRWLARRGRRTAETEFPYHRRSLVGAIVIVALLTAPVEVLFFELVIPWPWLRLLLLVVAVYSFIWLLGLYASLVVLPHRLEPSALRLRYGALAEGRIPYTAIATAERARRSAPGGRDGARVADEGGARALYLGVGGRTDLTLRLREPQTFSGLRGPTPPVETVHLATDDPDRLARALAERIGAASPTAVPQPASRAT
jgi:hypothetical protein